MDEASEDPWIDGSPERYPHSQGWTYLRNSPSSRRRSNRGRVDDLLSYSSSCFSWSSSAYLSTAARRLRSIL